MDRDAGRPADPAATMSRRRPRRPDADSLHSSISIIPASSHNDQYQSQGSEMHMNRPSVLDAFKKVEKHKWGYSQVRKVLKLHTYISIFIDN